MLDRRSVLLGAGSLLLGGGPARAQSPEQELSALLKERIDVGRETLGLVAGQLDGERRIVAAYGRSGADDDRPLDADTVFEIGSITKVFTALLLADMVGRGEVALDDTVSKFLPASTKVPDFEGTPITLLDLATYTSGLPRMPANFAPADPNNPYVDYTPDRLYAFLSDHKLGFKPGTHYEYANFGFGLLGHLLELRGGKSYEELIVSRICTPLGLDDTRITLSGAMRQRLAKGHNAAFAPTANWDFSVMAGAGALRSTLNDMFKLLEACLEVRPSPLAAAMKLALSVRRPRPQRNREVALGWFISDRFKDEIIWKDGGTGGYATLIGYSTLTKRNAIVLSNVADYLPNTSLALHLINAKYELPKIHHEVPVDPAILATYAGRYAVSPSFVLTVRPDGARLFVQATGQPEFEVHAESDADFFYAVVNAQITFAKAEGGVVPSLTLHQNGKDMLAPRQP
ncbi:serine hydrolase [Bradyrhizobium genosp. P]|uniref:serine hydrolase n=1 Tax=Bradyrhizobium genosp. P TaxID=83641 RepID=UPI003CF612E6